MIRVCVAGATGWVGSSLLPAIRDAPDLDLAGAVSRSAAGTPVDVLLPGFGDDLTVSGTVREALERRPDVLVEYTAPESARAHALEALAAGVHVVIGTSGLDEEDFEAIDDAARRHRVGAIAAGNFAITAVLLQRFAEEAARHLPAWEVIDYSSDLKPDAPSGTAREVVRRIAGVARPDFRIPVEETRGEPAARGLTMCGTQVHSVRVPGFVIGLEVVFGRDNERLTLRYDGGSGAEPYVAGTLLAVRSVGGIVGLRTGMDEVLEIV